MQQENTFKMIRNQWTDTKNKVTAQLPPPQSILFVISNYTWKRNASNLMGIY